MAVCDVHLSTIECDVGSFFKYEHKLGLAAAARHQRAHGRAPRPAIVLPGALW
jgi:hypothetical protein